MKVCIIFASIIMVFISLGLFVFKLDCDRRDKAYDILQEALEKAYFDGQQDYMKGDIRIEHIKDNCYKWIKSPWDNGDSPVNKIMISD